MTIRARLSLWYAVVMFAALMLMGSLLYYQLIIEPRQEARERRSKEGLPKAGGNAVGEFQNAVAADISRRTLPLTKSAPTNVGRYAGRDSAAEDSEPPLDPDIFEDVASIVLW